MPLRTVSVVADPRNAAPTNSNTAATITACLGKDGVRMSKMKEHAFGTKLKQDYD
jgi:hypothetical protein